MDTVRQQSLELAFAHLLASCKAFAAPEEDPIESTLFMTQDDARALLQKVIIALPAIFFENTESQFFQNLLVTLSQEFMLFHSTEDVTDDAYVDHLLAFIQFTILEMYKGYQQEGGNYAVQ